MFNDRLIFGSSFATLKLLTTLMGGVFATLYRPITEMRPPQFHPVRSKYVQKSAASPTIWYLTSCNTKELAVAVLGLLLLYLQSSCTYGLAIQRCCQADVQTQNKSRTRDRCYYLCSELRHRHLIPDTAMILPQPHWRTPFAIIRRLLAYHEINAIKNNACHLIRRLPKILQCFNYPLEPPVASFNQYSSYILFLLPLGLLRRKIFGMSWSLISWTGESELRLY